MPWDSVDGLIEMEVAAAEAEVGFEEVFVEAIEVFVEAIEEDSAGDLGVVAVLAEEDSRI